jgi:hypothetical protein
MVEKQIKNFFGIFFETKSILTFCKLFLDIFDFIANHIPEFVIFHLVLLS